MRQESTAGERTCPRRAVCRHVLLGESQVCGEARCQREWQGVPRGLCIYWSHGSFLGVGV